MSSIYHILKGQILHSVEYTEDSFQNLIATLSNLVGG